MDKETKREITEKFLQMKHSLESELCSKITEFENETGLDVTGIDYKRETSVSIGLSVQERYLKVNIIL